VFGTVAPALKWVIGILLALVILFALLRAGLRFLANFTGWARRLLGALQTFWEGLWSRRPRPQSAAPEESAAPARPRPFTSFRDPFQAGTAEGMSEDELVRYSFAALEAWAAERGLGRQPGETPLEFATRVGDEFPALEADLQRLAGFYVGLAYARRPLTPACREPLRRFWRLLIDAIERPLSAGVGADLLVSGPEA
jgi:hypothetical protein